MLSTRERVHARHRADGADSLHARVSRAARGGADRDVDFVLQYLAAAAASAADDDDYDYDCMEEKWTTVPGVEVTTRPGLIPRRRLSHFHACRL